MQFGKKGEFKPTHTISGRDASPHDHKRGLGAYGLSDYYVAIENKLVDADEESLIADILPSVKIYDTQARIQEIHAEQVANAEAKKIADAKKNDPRIAELARIEKELEALENLPASKPAKPIKVTSGAKDES